MRRFVALILAAAGTAICLIAACADKTPLPTNLPAPVYGGIDTNYVVISPNWTEFNGRALDHPNDVYVGYDQLIYICDTNNDRVIKLDIDGTFLAEYPVVHPVAITQDRGLDLLVVCGDYSRPEVVDGVDTVINYGDSVFRKRYRGDQPFARVFQAPYPYYIFNDRPQAAQFWSIAASFYPTKDYYLTDFWFGRLVEFSASDIPVGYHLSDGVGLGLTRFPVDLTMYQIAGQNYVALAQAAGNIGVQLFSFPNWVGLYESGDTLPPLIRFSARSYKDIAVDELSNFYLLLDSTDPLLGTNYYFYKFDRRGDVLLAFGELGSGEKQFRSPQGICHFEGILYIADAGNNRIVRMQLTTEARQ